MPLLTIQSANENVPVGTYTTTFTSLTDIETVNGKAYRWEFHDTKENRVISGLSDRESKPTCGNKTGRWLSALSGQPLNAGISVNTDDHVGKKYIVIIAAKENGGTKLETFSKLD